MKGLAAKPRPVVVVQATNLIRGNHPVLVCPLTSQLVNESIIRPTIIPSPTNGLRMPSQVMVDRLSGVLQSDIGDVIGHLDEPDLQSIDFALLTIMGLGQALMNIPKTGDIP